MSKRRYHTLSPQGENVEVIAGWDAPLSRLFLVVNRLEDGEDVETLFTNLDWHGGPDMDLWEITAVLSALGLPYPADWLREVARDEITEPGNDKSRHGRIIKGHHPPFEIDSQNHRP